MLVMSNGIAEIIGCVIDRLLEDVDGDYSIDVLGNRLICSHDQNITLNTQ